MKKGGGSESTIIIGPSKSVLVYALYSLEYVLGLARFRVFVPKLYYIIILYKPIFSCRFVSINFAFQTTVPCIEREFEWSFCVHSILVFIYFFLLYKEHRIAEHTNLHLFMCGSNDSGLYLLFRWQSRQRCR